MRKLKIILPALLLFIIGIALFFFLKKGNTGSRLMISSPFRNALFPREFPAPEFSWWSKVRDSSFYDIALYTKNKEYAIFASTRQQSWKPVEAEWDSIKILSDFKKIYFTVKRRSDHQQASVYFTISRDSVGAPILYRQMPLPFIVAEKKLDSMSFMLINIGSRQLPHTVMKNFPVCGNCHSFSADGKTIGLDLDAGLRDKGGYFISPVQDTILFNIQNYRSWSVMEKRRTFGLFSKLSPDGRYVVTTVKDRVVMKNFPYSSLQNFIYSQLFFPVNGHLAIYDRQTKILKELPGASSEQYVQSNAVWTPDGKYIIFSRAEALPRDSDIYQIDVKNEELIKQFVERKKSFKFNLYKIPFNGGNGGTAEPVKGASNNGKSNYFPAVSPDGKWLVFCQAENFMLLMPDSRLYIVPAIGGTARELDCNFNSMNSWHSWSPNSKWIVFVSKILNPYTDMYLSHIDEKGNASIPVLVDWARSPFKVVNYPEFINRKPEYTFDMKYDFVELQHISAAVRKGNIEEAKRLYYKLEKQHMYFFRKDYEDLVLLLKNMGMNKEAEKYSEIARRTIDSTVFNQ